MKIEKETAKRLYDQSPDWFKAKLIEEFGADTFVKNDFENIKTFEDACKLLNIIPESVTTKKDTPDEAAYKQLKIIIEAINKDWKPDWNNASQRKWFPWFEVLSSGFGFSYSDCSYGGSDASVGSRLCFESEDKANYAGEQFLELYRVLLT